MNVSELPIKEIFSDDDFNCRGKIIPNDVRDLMNSIRMSGLLEPIVVQPYDKHPPHKYRIIVGHRRFLAVSLLKQEKISCIIKEGVDDLEARRLNLMENLDRKDLNVMQEARALRPFRHMTLKALAEYINKSTGWVQTRFNALALPEEIQEKIEAGIVPVEHIRTIYSLPSKTQKFEAVRILIDRKLKGEKGRIILKKVKKRFSALKKEPRSLHEIFRVQDIIFDAVGNNIGTRCLAWAGGMISTKDLMEDVLKIATENGGNPHAIPKEMFEEQV